jgi:hypothetical protein
MPTRTADAYAATMEADRLFEEAIAEQAEIDLGVSRPQIRSPSLAHRRALVRDQHAPATT